MNISILGSSSVGRDSRDWRVAYEIAKKLAAEGHLVFHGGTGGVMTAAAEGAGENSRAVGCVELKDYADPTGPQVSADCQVLGIEVGLGARTDLLTRRMDAVVIMTMTVSKGTIAEMLYLITGQVKKCVIVGSVFSSVLDAVEGLGIDLSCLDFVVTKDDSMEYPIKGIARQAVSCIR